MASRSARSRFVRTSGAIRVPFETSPRTVSSRFILGLSCKYFLCQAQGGKMENGNGDLTSVLHCNTI